MDKLLSLSLAMLITAVVPVHADTSAATDETKAELKITVHKSPSCGCCKVWIEHLKLEGFVVEALNSDDMNAVKTERGVPRSLASCHTAVIDGYTVEGHVPADDIKRLVAEKPDAKGLAVPGMPIGSPGMEIGDRIDPYDVILFGDAALRVYASYGSEQQAHEDHSGHEH
ncbi:MAG: DUF411 domain-containing protein [Pseudomonadota bacterium]